MDDLIKRDAAVQTLSDYAETQQDLDYYRDMLMKIPAVNRWIPVSEQMPDRFDTVLLAILSKNGYDEPAYYVTIGGLKNGKEFESYTGEMAEGEKVTHWMPLPNEPEVKKDDD